MKRIENNNDSIASSFEMIRFRLSLKGIWRRCDEQPYGRYADKPCVLHGDFRGHGFQMSDYSSANDCITLLKLMIGDVFIDVAYFFEKPSNTGIDKYTEPPTKQNL